MFPVVEVPNRHHVSKFPGDLYGKMLMLGPQPRTNVLIWDGGRPGCPHVSSFENPCLVEITVNFSWFSLNMSDVSLFRIALGNWRMI